MSRPAKLFPLWGGGPQARRGRVSPYPSTTAFTPPSSAGVTTKVFSTLVV
ncbi:MAG: hypothetical protein JWP92_2627 [Caulobacter sp.]|nr:hypothetical protein [Caulobacter sp.]